MNVYGDDLEDLDRTAQAVADVMRDIPGAADVQLRSPTGTPLLQVRLQLDRVASWGLRPMQVIDAMQVAYEGRVVGRSYQDERVIDVAVLLDPEHRRRPDDVAELPLRTPDGVIVPLRRVADLPGGADRLVSDAVGIEAVIVNGTVIRERGKDVVSPDGDLPGQLLRSRSR